MKEQNIPAVIETYIDKAVFFAELKQNYLLSEDGFQNDILDIVTKLQDMGESHELDDDIAGAIACYENSINVFEHLPDLSDPLLQQKANTFHKLWELRGAKEDLENTIAQREKIAHKGYKDRISLAKENVQLALIHERELRLADAIHCYEKAIQCYEKVLGRIIYPEDKVNIENKIANYEMKLAALKTQMASSTPAIKSPHPDKMLRRLRKSLSVELVIKPVTNKESYEIQVNKPQAKAFLIQ